MKQQSKAEEALNRQIKEIKNRIQDEIGMLEGQKIKINTLVEVKNQLEDEISRLYAIRKKASEKVAAQ